MLKSITLLERTHNLKRLTDPLLRIGKKGEGKFKNQLE